MQEIVKGQIKFARPEFSTLRELLDMVGERYAELDAYRYHENPQGEDRVHSYADLRADIFALATALLERGASAGAERLAVIGDNSYAWVLAFNAAVCGLGTAIPLDRQLPREEMLRLLQRGKAGILAYNGKHKDSVLALLPSLPEIRLFIALDDAATVSPAESSDPRFVSIDRLIAEGRAALAAGHCGFELLKPTPDQPASIVFTSGTTDLAKGVVLTQLNIASNALAAEQSFQLYPGERALSVLPLHHCYENTVGMYTFWAFGLCICFSDGLRYIGENLKNWQVSIILGVPLLIENMYKQIRRGITKSRSEKTVARARLISRYALKIGIDLRARLFHKMHEAFGGKLHLAVIGAAPMDPEICLFFQDIGIHCLPGYGLTEAGPVLSSNTQDALVANSAGRAMPGVSLKIDPQVGGGINEEGYVFGEILAKGPNIMLGYLDDPERTAEVITADGWLRTGDIGYLDSQEFLHITGRCKTMLVLNNGKKAFPEEFELLLKQNPAILEAYVWQSKNARKQEIICCKLQIAVDRLPESTRSETEIEAYLTALIHEVNQKLPSYKAIGCMVWTEKPLQTTTTLKVKRPAEQNAIAERLEALGLEIFDLNGKRID